MPMIDGEPNEKDWMTYIMTKNVYTEPQNIRISNGGLFPQQHKDILFVAARHSPKSTTTGGWKRAVPPTAQEQLQKGKPGLRQSLSIYSRKKGLKI